MQIVGLGLLLIGLAGLLVVGVYYALEALFASDEIPDRDQAVHRRRRRRVLGAGGLGRPRPDTGEQKRTIRGG